MQGSQQFLEMTHHILTGFQDLVCIFRCSDTTFTTNDSWRESHVLAGGVTTNGKWLFYSPNIELPPIASFGIQRLMKHMLQATERASPLNQLSKSVMKVLTPVNWKDKIPAVLIFSVFDKLAPVTRLLRGEELMDMYDIQLNTQQELFKYWSSNKTKSTCAYTQQIPTKILREVSLRLVRVLHKWWGHDSKPPSWTDQSIAAKILNIAIDTVESMQNEKSV